MRYWLVLLVLVLGCIGEAGPEPVYINAKEGFFDVEFPEVGGYEFINLLRVETDDALDEERGVVSAASYVGEPSFTYTIQELNYVPELDGLGDTGSRKVEGVEVYYWYWGEIPFVISGAHTVVWNENNTLYSISVRNRSLAFDVVEDVLKAEGMIDFDEYGFLEGVERLPDPYPPWELYTVSEFKKLGYDLSTGYYITGGLDRVDLMVLHGDVDYVIGKMVDELAEPVGGGVGGLVSYEGRVYVEEADFYRKIYANGDIGIVVTTPFEQKEGNLEFIEYLIERAGATQ